MKRQITTFIPKTTQQLVEENPGQGFVDLSKHTGARNYKVLSQQSLEASKKQDIQTIKTSLKQMKAEGKESLMVSLSNVEGEMTASYLKEMLKTIRKQAMLRSLKTGETLEDLANSEPRIQTLYQNAQVKEIVGTYQKTHAEQFEHLIQGYELYPDIADLKRQLEQVKDQELGLKLQAQMTTGRDKTNLELEITDLQRGTLVPLAEKIEELKRSSKEVAIVDRLEDLIDKKKQLDGKDHYVMFDSRKEITEKLMESMFKGESVLLTGATGTGKTVLAMKTIQKIQKKMVEMNVAQLIDEKKLTQELKNNPEFVHVLSGNANMTVGDLIAKVVLKAVDDGKGGKVMETTTELGKVLKAYSQGKILLFDEMDTVPTDILMRLKHLATLNPGDMYQPQENGVQVNIVSNQTIGTANLKGGHHSEREDLDPAIVRLFRGITAGYLSEDEAYDMALISMMQSEGYIADVNIKEFEKNGFVVRMVEFMKMIENNYMGHETSGTSQDDTDQQLSKAVLDIGNFTKLWKNFKLNQRRGATLRNFREYVIDNLIDWTSNQGYPLGDRKLLIKFANKKGLLDHTHIEKLLKNSPDMSEKILKELMIQRKTDLKLYDTNEELINPYELAVLDPYKKRNLEQLERGAWHHTKLLLQGLNEESIKIKDEKLQDLIDHVIDQTQNDKMLDEKGLEDLVKALAKQKAWELIDKIKDLPLAGEIYEKTGIKAPKPKVKPTTSVVPEKIKQLETERKAIALQFLVDNDMNTPENRAMIEAVEFTEKGIVIGGVPRSYNKLKAKDLGLSYTTLSQYDADMKKSNTISHVIKGEGNWADEDYFNFAMVEKLHKEGKVKMPTKEDMENTLKALPGGSNSTSWTRGSAKIWSLLCNMSISGSRYDGKWDSRDTDGYAWSFSGISSHYAWAFTFGSSEGDLAHYHRENAFPVLPLSENS